MFRDGWVLLSTHLRAELLCCPLSLSIILQISYPIHLPEVQNQLGYFVAQKIFKGRPEPEQQETSWLTLWLSYDPALGPTQTSPATLLPMSFLPSVAPHGRQSSRSQGGFRLLCFLWTLNTSSTRSPGPTSMQDTDHVAFSTAQMLQVLGEFRSSLFSVNKCAAFTWGLLGNRRINLSCAFQGF